MFESAKIVTILGLVLSLIPFSVASEQKKALRFGSVAMDIPAVMHKRLTPLTTYLSKELNREVVLDLSPNMKDAIKKVSSGEVDFAYLTPVAYIRSHEAGNTQLIAKTVTQNKGSFQLMIVVREDSDIKNPSDLFGRSFAFGDKAALLQRAAVLGAGVPLEKLANMTFSGITTIL
ncbi:MAG: PhnD/SsuA/transferrin family substrate-binding protein [Gammaproteobacteria bacterium]|nr:PhnD/SsuA/transferrin family substrate-binding protein [Gammaproteobacteria bacterium]